MADLLVDSSSLVPDVAALSAALARMDRVLATIMELSPSAVRVVDVSGRIVRSNGLTLAPHAASHAVTLRELWEGDQPHRVADNAVLGFLDTPGMRALGGHTTRRERLTVRRYAAGETSVIECSASPVFGTPLSTRTSPSPSLSATTFAPPESRIEILSVRRRTAVAAFGACGAA